MLITLALSACTLDDSGVGKAVDPTFPEDFLWGTAIAGFQVDPGCPSIDAEICEDRASDWYQWVTDPDLVAESGNHLSGEPLSAGPGHHELWAEDLDAAVALGTNTIRVSIEWSRLFPVSTEGATTPEELALLADPDAVAWYDAYIDGIVARGLTPMVTLNHYTLPLWVHDGKACHEELETCAARGWVDGDRIVPLIAAYSGYAASRWGDRVRWWGTLNEPLAIVLAGYLLPSADRTNPPGIVNTEAAFAVVFNLVEGHAAMYDAVHAHDDDAMVGLVPNLAAVQPLDAANPTDVTGAEHGDYVYNRVMLNAAVYGAFDRDLDGVAEEQRDDVAGRMDFLGVNYYTRITFRGLNAPLFADYPLSDFYPEVLWEEYPEGIGEVSALAASYGVPVVITENGTTPTDESGETFLRPHLQALLDERERGTDIRGYCYWSLIDNYEWNHGTSMRFGLYEVDPDSKARSLRPVGETYQQIIAAGRP
jgi:beta-galactosidase